MNLLEHPSIYKFSAVLTVFNTASLIVCICGGNTAGIVLNGIFLLFNLAATIGNFHLRHHRATMIEDRKMERRNQLIRLTIGE